MKELIVPEHLYQEIKNTFPVSGNISGHFGGIKIIVVPTEYKNTSEQKRKNRRSRINKKWRKLYGYKKIRIDDIIELDTTKYFNLGY